MRRSSRIIGLRGLEVQGDRLVGAAPLGLRCTKAELGREDRACGF